MKSLLLFLLTLAVIVVGYGQDKSATPSSQIASDRITLLAGVESLPRFGSPGPVVAYGESAFPLIVAASDKASETVAVAGSMGKGRVVIFGHTGYLGGEAESGDLGRLLGNAVSWCGQKETLRAGLKGAKCQSLIAREGLRIDPLRAFDAAALGEFDVVIVSVQDLTSETEAAALREFIEKGGGLIAAMTGWAFSQTSGGKDFSANRGNGVLAGAGLAWTDQTLCEGPLSAAPQGAPMLNALSALVALRTANEPIEIEQGTRTIQLALASMPLASRPPFQVLLTETLRSKTETGLSDRARALLTARLTPFLPLHEIRPHPAAETFPGRAAPGALPTTTRITINPAVPGWHSTGLYADAGAKISVVLPPDGTGHGLTVRIGCHSDRLYHLPEWKRLPEITTVTPLTETKTLAANAFGGLIYIVVPEKTKSATSFEVSIEGGIESPLYVLDQTSDSQWHEMQKLHSPWAELACRGLIITVPAAVAREVAAPGDLMRFWQRIVDAQDDLAGTAAKRRRPERIVPDLQISAGFMHSGYPIMIHLPEARDMIRHGPDHWPGWGAYHELGHNHQDPAWTFEGTGEVTCNLFSLYMFEAVHGQPMLSGHGAIAREVQAKKRGMHLRAGAPFDKWKSDPFLALGSYIQLIEAFGFGSLRTVLHSYDNPAFGPRPKSDDEKRNQWMVRYARIVGRNLGPFFEEWGIPVSAAAKAEIAALPAWMPAQ